MKHAGRFDTEATRLGSSPQWVASPSELSAEQWASACTARLIQLRPASERQALHTVALDLARDLRHFDPAMAAEMEHEGGMLDA